MSELEVPLALGTPFHLGLVVSHFEAALDELSVNLGCEWATVQRRCFDVRQPNGVVEADIRFTCSVGDAPHYEIIEATPGTVWAYGGGGVHHVAYWTDDLKRDCARLADGGFVWEATYHNPEVRGPFAFTMHLLPRTGMRVELVDTARRPAFDKWLAGGDRPPSEPERNVFDD